MGMRLLLTFRSSGAGSVLWKNSYVYCELPQLLVGRHCEGSARSNPVRFQYSLVNMQPFFWITSFYSYCTAPTELIGLRVCLLLTFRSSGAWSMIGRDSTILLRMVGRHCEGFTRSNPVHLSLSRFIAFFFWIASPPARNDERQ